MDDVSRLLNVFKLIRLLSSGTGYSVERLANRFNVHSRTIYRYFKTLEETGFDIVKKNERYFIQTETKNSLLPLLDSNELGLLKDAVLSLHEQHPQKLALLKKLYALSDLENLAELIIDEHKAHNYKLLISAIKQQMQVRLLKYHSPNSQTQKDRIVEPIGFTSNLHYLVAYDTTLKSIRLFKPSRMDDVQILSQSFTLQANHEWQKPDLFGMTAEPKTEVTLYISPFAARLLEEEYPESKVLLSEQKTDWLEVNLNVQGFDGIGRFILGLPGELEVIEPKELRTYLKERQHKKIWENED